MKRSISKLIKQIVSFNGGVNIIRKNVPFDIQIESAGPWSEKDRELFIELMATAIAQYLADPANREAFKKQVKEEASESI